MSVRAPKPCALPDCVNTVYNGARYCAKHASRMRAHGDPNTVAPSGPKRGAILNAVGYRCINCGEPHTQVKDSRSTAIGHVRRRRKCDSCHMKFSTIEVPLDFYEAADVGNLRSEARC